jgi:hypothetical protein
MIRRDYIIRMLEEFFEVLSRIKGYRNQHLWQQANTELDSEFQRIVGAGSQAIAKLSETELLARLIQGEPTMVVHEKTLMLTTLLKEAGDVAAEQGDTGQSRASYLKGLHLLLDVLARSDAFEFPEYVPRVEMFISALSDAALPMATRAMLMRHFETAGEYGRAEDYLFSMLEDEPSNPALLDFGVTFYNRINSHNDATLAGGNLPRAELQSSLAELRARQKSTPRPA